ncbi:uncharacterized protein LOC131649732 [Vicia villosa]|uniref:uncharacterized protein LOC131649732 n=1 Tax=Vicia villosa TaxID=3911 RepID=UPI00273C9633|nr:uncharacterized protein LOC131649732 [Vicia villosa]
MASNVTATREATRRTHTYSFHREGLVQLGQLGGLITGHNKTVFTENYGNILTLLDSHVDEWEKPDLNNIANALYLSIGDVHGNWKKNGSTQGFYMSFLVEKAQELANKKMWEAFNALLAVLIYGIVMFPNIHKFVDLAAICLFVEKNPVPTLLADTYYSVHSRYGKGGAIRNCLPLLYTWFKSHLPTSGPFVTSTQKWHQRIMGLTGNDIVWCPTGMDVEKVITSCGTFDNGTDLKGLEKVVSAWNDIHTSDQISLGEKNAVAKQAYTDWVENRVKDRLLPFLKVNPLYEQPPKVPIAIMPAENCIPVNMESTQLHEKRSDARPKHCLVDQKRVELTHEAKMLKGGSSRVQKRARTEKGERDTTSQRKKVKEATVLIIVTGESCSVEVPSELTGSAWFAHREGFMERIGDKSMAEASFSRLLRLCCSVAEVCAGWYYVEIGGRCGIARAALTLWICPLLSVSGTVGESVSGKARSRLLLLGC